jgi:hypothetical protein
MGQLFNAIGEYFDTGTHVAYLGGATAVLLLLFFVFARNQNGGKISASPPDSYLARKYKIQGFLGMLLGSFLLVFGIGVILFDLANKNNPNYQMLFFPGGSSDLFKLGGTFIGLGLLSLGGGWFMLSRTTNS